MQQRPQFLVQRDPAGKLLQLGRRQGQRIELDAEMIGQRHQRPERQGVTAAGLVIGRGRDMGAEDFRREEQRCAALDFQSLERIGAVRRPEAIGARQHAIVGAPAARGAAFDFERRVGAAEAVHQRIDGPRLPGRGGPSVAIPDMGEVAVHVPFHIGDVMRRQDGVDGAEEIVADFGPRQVEHQLVARGEQRTPGDLQRPVRMGAEQVGLFD